MQGNVDLLIQAAEQSNGRFEVNEDKTKLRKAPGAEEEQEAETKEQVAKPDEKMLDYWRQQNTRSIYAVSNLSMQDDYEIFIKRVERISRITRSFKPYQVIRLFQGAWSCIDTQDAKG